MIITNKKIKYAIGIVVIILVVSIGIIITEEFMYNHVRDKGTHMVKKGIKITQMDNRTRDIMSQFKELNDSIKKYNIDDLPELHRTYKIDPITKIWIYFQIDQMLDKMIKTIG